MKADPTVTAIRKPKKEVSGIAKVKTDPWKCSSCGAMSFVPTRIHDVLCYNYRDNKTLIEGTHVYYKEYLARKASQEAEEAERKAREKVERKRNAKSAVVQAKERTG